MEAEGRRIHQHKERHPCRPKRRTARNRERRGYLKIHTRIRLTSA